MNHNPSDTKRSSGNTERSSSGKERDSNGKGIEPVDTYVGKQVRQRRWLVGMTQQQLAQAVGVKFQQIQKYETGMNRISASRLWHIAEALDTPIWVFFSGLRQHESFDETQKKFLRTDSRETLELLRAYYGLDKDTRQNVLALLRRLHGALGKSDSPAPPTDA